MDSEQVREILDILAATYPEARTALKFNNPFELLVATILSAQSTDVQVNKITKRLFAMYKTPGDIAALKPEELAEEIKGCGLYRNKSANIVAASRLLCEKYGGQVPATMEELTELPGVGRKTAGVVLINAFGRPAMPVDTHVFRVANRLGLVRAGNVRQAEDQLRQAIPPDLWGRTHHWLVSHGRQVCRARNPRCRQCVLAHLCQSREQQTSTNREGKDGQPQLPFLCSMPV